MMNTIANRLAAERRDQGFTQDDLATSARVTKNAISAIELGKTKNPRPETLFELADALHVNPRWLALGKGPRTGGVKGLIGENPADYEPAMPRWAASSKYGRALTHALDDAHTSGSLNPKVLELLLIMVDALTNASRKD